ncbi:discoidin domain-containing protein [Streptomyces sp. NBC_00873]|uniref:galactose-binding domain-containing protein n=1 Tax=unclassified Streptomyces TaxID=2593676 RepID=UPI003867685D|nr:discoidin domain-containing protein [Streptomyces sp. NBC_00873]WTA48249.1 discoidin domain-containing protein [Streptomyces sp. NBC_00842]
MVAVGSDGRESQGATTVRLLANLAAGKTATQSSTYNGASASRAVDGEVDGVFDNGSVTHTNSESQPWWQVDLGASRDIGDVLAWNRTDTCCVSRLGDYYVLVSDNPITGTLDQALAQPGVSAYHQTVAPAPKSRVSVGRLGRYVRVQLTGTNYLSLAEVQAFATGAYSG